MIAKPELDGSISTAEAHAFGRRTKQSLTFKRSRHKHKENSERPKGQRVKQEQLGKRLFEFFKFLHTD